MNLDSMPTLEVHVHMTATNIRTDVASFNQSMIFRYFHPCPLAQQLEQLNALVLVVVCRPHSELRAFWPTTASPGY